MIVVLAPYTKSETTAAALRVMDLALALGHDVRFVACGTQEQRVHPYWDKRIYRDHKTRVIKTAAKASTAVHFQIHDKTFNWSNLVASIRGGKLRHVLVCTERMAQTADMSLLENFSKIVCTTKECRVLLTKKLEKKYRRRLVYTRWDSGLTETQREGYVTESWVKACFFCDAPTVDYCGPLALQVMDETLRRFPSLGITVASTKSWCRHDRATVCKLTKTYGSRFLTKRLQTLHEFPQICHDNDWVVLPGVRASFGIPATTAIACGAMVLANEIEPYTEIVRPMCGLVVPCQKYQGVAIPELGRWLEVANHAFGDRKLLYHMQAQDSGLGEIQKEFRIVWENLLVD